MNFWHWIVQAYALMTLVPFLILPLAWIILYGLFRDHKTAARRAADITMFFLIGSVASLYDHLFETEFKGFWMIALFLLLFAGLLGNAQNRLRGHVDAAKIVRAVWRLGFLVLAFFYILFFLIGLIKSLINI